MGLLLWTAPELQRLLPLLQDKGDIYFICLFLYEVHIHHTKTAHQLHLLKHNRCLFHYHLALLFLEVVRGSNEMLN